MTVVIPVWGNYVDFISEAVASASGDPLVRRVLIVDNASTPPVEAFDGCEVVRSERRLTRGAIRNLGLARTDTEYVVFLDADDLLLPEALPALVDMLDRFPDSPAAVGGILVTDGSPYRLPRETARRLAQRPRLFAWINAIWSIMPIQGCALLRTSSVRDAGGYADADHGEDWALASALAFRGRVVFVLEPALVYRFRPDSPAVSRESRRRLLAAGRRIRARLRRDPGVTAGRGADILLAFAQVAAVLIGQPVARTSRRIRSVPR